jgi:HSP20 family protein
MFFDVVDTYRNEKIYEGKEGFHILIEMAGVKKEDISIETEGNELVIEAERKTSDTRPFNLRTGKISKRYHIGSTLLSTDNVKASLADGVLEVFVPKQAQRLTKKIQIQ